MKIPTQRGFTLVETMVALGIFVIVTAIVFVGNSRFNNTIFLTNLAYDLALTVSRAQSYGINVRPFDSATKPFEVGYGVHFKRGPATTDPKESDNFSFVLFADTANPNKNKHYDNPSEFLERYLIRRGNYISRLYWLDSDGNEKPDLPNLLDYADITFLRPNPDANFYCGSFGCTGASAVGIEVSSSDGIIKKKIIIGATGQISVESVQ